jgi:hypothetical protein
MESALQRWLDATGPTLKDVVGHSVSAKEWRCDSNANLRSWRTWLSGNDLLCEVGLRTTGQLRRLPLDRWSVGGQGAYEPEAAVRR